MLKYTYICFYLFFLPGLFSCANTINKSEEDTKKNVINEANQSTQFFRISEGIEVSLLTPINFHLTAEHYGFVSPTSFSRIKVFEIESPFAQYMKHLSKENLLKSKLLLTKTEDIQLQNSNVKLLTIRENIAGTYFEKLWLIAGDELSSIQVEASYPEGSPLSHKQAMKNSVLSLRVALKQSARVFTGLPFTLLSTPNFTIKKRYSNSIVLLTEDTEDTKQSVVFSHGLIKQQIENTQQLSEHFIKNSQTFSETEVIDTSAIKLDGIPAITTTAYAVKDKEPIVIYQILSYQKGKFLLIQAVAHKDNKKAFIKKVNTLTDQFVFK